MSCVRFEDDVMVELVVCKLPSWAEDAAEFRFFLSLSFSAVRPEEAVAMEANEPRALGTARGGGS
jgi:hypothetical protein